MCMNESIESDFSTSIKFRSHFLHYLLSSPSPICFPLVIFFPPSFFLLLARSCLSHLCFHFLSSPHQILIPISLYLSIELVKIGQIFFITNDIDLYDEQSDTRVQCKALNITEDLGQIQYIFSDKTGTLTENKMVFRRCSIMGTEYPHKENGNLQSFT